MSKECKGKHTLINIEDHKLCVVCGVSYYVVDTEEGKAIIMIHKDGREEML